MATTLGKRGRDELDIADAPARSTRAKRRAVASDTTLATQQSHSEQHISKEFAVPIKQARGTTSKRAVSTKTTSRVSPSKAKKLNTTIEIYQDDNHDVIPITPRHRDALAKKVTVTPKHRLIEGRDALTPRTPHTTSRSSTAVYNQARQLFSRSSNPGRLVGRVEERAELAQFIEQRLQASAGGCVYISGPPGTGKSALVSEVCGEQFAELRATTINCMSIRSTNDLTTKLAAELGLDGDSSVKGLQRRFMAKTGTPYLVVLDEVDRLVELDLALLYNLFEWSLSAKSRLILVGIANALDLTDRCLPQLRSRSLKPELLPFLPYSAAQIADVLTAKVRSLEVGEPGALPPFLHPTAIQFCAKKIAAQTGDLRKAFDICHRAIDLVEQETITRDAKAALLESPSKTPLMDNINLSSPLTPKSASKSPCKQNGMAYTIATAPRATIAHMAKVTSQVFSNGASQRLTTLNLQQKAVLCSIAALEKRKRALQLERVMFATPSKSDRSAPTTKQLYESYSGLCKRSDTLHPLTVVEFRDVVSGLEAQGLLTGADGKHGSFVTPMTPSKTPSRKNKTGFGGVCTGDDRRIASVVGEKELRAVLEGAGGELLREIIDGDC
ncbi:hypothetical protein AMS68_006137 [Peltaster fructicola]|uniref:Cell division control protein n=1 Tax=Peltaster fructicola TaxID=286661 RepID=A0A6H0Y1V2_9PEZI|nr:hypothetical protein AMS68_006137 [Peltaster fructicola]